jgi:hypothetical protein
MLADEGIIKLVCATIVAARIGVTPPWIMIVGSSSGGKSAILNALVECRGITPIDDLTTNTLLSGYKAGGKEASMLFNLPEDPIFLFKDFSTILTKSEETQQIIFSQLRRVWDGDFNKTTGMGDEQKWEGRVGLLGASTSKIYSVLPQLAEVGERLVLYHFQMPSDRKSVARFSSRRLKDSEALKEMRTAFREYVDSIQLPASDEELPQITDELNEELIDLSDLATRARSSIERDQYSREKNVVMSHDLEMPMRLLKTISTVAMGLMVINGNNDLKMIDKRILYRLALDSIPRNRKLLLNHLVNNGQVSLDAFETNLNMERGLAQRTADDLHSLGMTIKSRGISRQWVYKLKSEFEEVLIRFSEIANIDKELLRGNIVDEVSEPVQPIIDSEMPLPEPPDDYSLL